MRQRPSGVIGVISIDAGDWAADKERLASRDDDGDLSTTIGRLARAGQDAAPNRRRRFAAEGRQVLLRFPRTSDQRETVLRTAHLARLATDLACELATFRLRLADSGGNDAA